MKSKFFGYGAKLALAILAVGTTLTSCYDSENGDVTKPYVAPDAVYSFVGTVTNNITGAPVANASVSLSGAVTATATTDARGAYQAVVKVNGGTTGTVTIAVAAKANEYDAASVDVTVEKLENGQAATYYKDVLVNYTAYLPEGLKITTSANAAVEDVVLSGENGENISLDIMNDTDEPLLISRNFDVAKGVVVAEQTPVVYTWTATKAVSEDVLAAVKEYINGDLGAEPTEKFGKETVSYDILVAPMSALKNVTVSYLYEVKNYDFTYGTEAIHVQTKRIVKVTFDYAQTSFGHYHGHGHGHGHGENLNAGGGIFE